KAGVVWINSTNLFDAAAGFGGYRESGFGREGGREGMWEYLSREAGSGRREAGTTRKGSSSRARSDEPQTSRSPLPSSRFPLPALDRTPKLFIGGKQARPDQGYSRRILSPSGELVGESPEGNRKDLRNAVEAAHKAAGGWARATGHNRGQILYYIAENLSARAREFAERIDAMTEVGGKKAAREVDVAVSRLFTYGAWADKYDGAVHSVPIRGVAIAMTEPIGVMALVCPTDYPLLGMVSLVAPAIAAGNTTIVIPSQDFPLSATDFYSVLETSDVPDGVINIVTGDRDALA